VAEEERFRTLPRLSRERGKVSGAVRSNEDSLEQSGALTGHRRFESTSLQRGVSCEPAGERQLPATRDDLSSGPPTIGTPPTYALLRPSMISRICFGSCGGKFPWLPPRVSNCGEEGAFGKAGLIRTIRRRGPRQIINRSTEIEGPG
jgi:hypothetical protein